MHRYPNGIVTYVHHLRGELLRQGHRVSVFTLRAEGGAAEPDVHVVAPSVAFRLRRRLEALAAGSSPGALGWGRMIAAKIAEVHAHDPIDVVEMEESFGWCGDVQRRQPVPLVVKLHGPACLTLFDAERETPAARRRMAVEGEALRQVHAIVSPSRHTLQRTLAHYGLAPEFAEVVPNPISVDDAYELWEASRCEPRTLLFVGRFDKLKGGDIMLLGFRRLLELEPDLRLIFVGPDRGLAGRGGVRTGFEAFCAAHFDAAQRERIDWRGAMPREQIHALRTQAAVTVVSSRFDNQPATLLEAMIQACPVVAVNAGGVGELVEHGVSGLLARPDDIEDLCMQLRRVLNDVPAAARMGRRAREFVLQRHALAPLAAQALQAWRRAVALQRGGALAPAVAG